MIQSNIGELVGKLQHQLKNWIMLTLSWLGRIVVVKMNVLPWLLFYFLDLNLAVPKKMIMNIETLISKFIWKFKPLRIKAGILQQNVQKGGLALPNILKY